jgi:hypothetical protein
MEETCKEHGADICEDCAYQRGVAAERKRILDRLNAWRPQYANGSTDFDKLCLCVVDSAIKIVRE